LQTFPLLGCPIVLLQLKDLPTWLNLQIGDDVPLELHVQGKR